MKKLRKLNTLLIKTKTGVVMKTASTQKEQELHWHIQDGIGGDKRWIIRALIGGKPDEKTAQSQWHPLARLLEDNQERDSHRDKDIEHLDHHIEIGIERDGEANMLKGTHILRSE